MRFTNIVIPKGTQILGAHLEVTAFDPAPPSGTVYSHISAEATDNAPTYSAGVDQARLLNKTASSVNWNTSPASWTSGTVHDSPDVSSVIQEMVNRPGWAPGNALSLYWEDWAGQTANVPFLRMAGQSFNNSGPNLAPKLIITTGAVSNLTSSTVLPTGQTTVETRWTDASKSQPAQVTTTSYDALGEATSTADSVQGQTVTLYDAGGHTTSQWTVGTDGTTTPQAERTSYDPAGQAVTETPAGNDTSATTTTYDAGGRQLKVVNPDGSWSSYTYDADGNQTSVTSPDDTSTATSYTGYDLGGRSVATTDQAGATSSSVYDNAGRLISSGGSAAANASGTSSVYDNAGWVVRSADGAGVVTSNTLDADGRVIVSSVGGLTTRTTYDGCGRVIYQQNPDGSTITYSYDAFGRQSSEVHASPMGETVKDIETSYDGAGREISSSDLISHITRTMAYASNQASATVTTVSVAPRPDTTFAQSSASAASGLESGEVLTWTSPDGSLAVTRSVTATDSAGRATSETIDAGLTPLQGSHFSYDVMGNLSGRRGSGLVASATVSHDATTGLKTSDMWPLALGTVSQTETFTYTPDGRLSSWKRRDPDGATPSQNTTYDSAGDVTLFAGHDASGAAFSYTFTPANGHIATMTCAGSTTTYTYDPQMGYRTGAMTNGQGATAWRYGYDGAGRLATVGVGSSRVATYAYDGNGQRLSSQTASGSVVTSIGYDYDGQQLEALAATVTGSVSGTETYDIAYAYTPDGRPYSGVFDDSTGTSQPVYFSIVTNDHGDVLELLDKATRLPATATTRGGSPSASLATSRARRSCLRRSRIGFAATSRFVTQAMSTTRTSASTTARRATTTRRPCSSSRPIRRRLTARRALISTAAGTRWGRWIPAVCGAGKEPAFRQSSRR